MRNAKEGIEKMDNTTSPKTVFGIAILIIASIFTIMSFANGLWLLALLIVGGGAWLGIWLLKEGLFDQGLNNDAKRMEREYKPLTITVPRDAVATSTYEETPQSSQPEQAKEQTNYTLFVSGETYLGLKPGSTGGLIDELAIPTSSRYAGMYVIGVQGVGKSSFLEGLIYQEINNDQAVIVIDPHGDLIEHCIGQLPGRRLPETYILDIEDIDYPFGLNLFSIRQSAGVTEQSSSQDRILHVFEKCFPETSRMLLEKYLGNIAPVFFANAQTGYAMTDIPKFLRDDSFRAKLLRSKKVRYAVREFWEDEYSQLSPSKRQTETASLATRLNRFVRSPIVGNIIGQASTTIDFRKAIENRHIIFIKLPVKTLKEDAQLIGTMLIAQIHAAIFSFGDLPQEKRPGFSLFVDEFQHFATSDFAEMFTEGRKFGSRVTVAHQYRNQLPDYLKSASSTAHTKVCFQTTAEDSRELAHYYQDIIQPKPDRDSLDPDPIGYLLEHGSSNSELQFFTDNYTRPLAQTAQASVIVAHAATFIMQQDRERQQTRKEAARVHLEALNRFAFEAQVQGTWQQTLPKEIIDFCLYTFRIDYNKYDANRIRDYAAAVDKQSVYTIFSDPAIFASAQAVNQLRDKLVNAYKRTSSNYLAYSYLYLIDDFFITISNLRKFIQELVYNPIGKIKPVSTADIASLIVNLPRRHAFIRSGSTVFQIRTDDTPPSVDHTILQFRKRNIQEQTRATYCRPASEVDTAISKRLGLQTAPEPGEAQPEPEIDQPHETANQPEQPYTPYDEE